MTKAEVLLQSLLNTGSRDLVTSCHRKDLDGAQSGIGRTCRQLRTPVATRLPVLDDISGTKLQHSLACHRRYCASHTE